MVIAPARMPSWVGVKVNLTVQLLFTASVPPQVVEPIAKSPLGTILLMFNVPAPTLEMVNDFPAAVPPTTSLPQVRAVAERDTAGAPVTVTGTMFSFVKIPVVPTTVTK